MNWVDLSRTVDKFARIIRNQAISKLISKFFEVVRPRKAIKTAKNLTPHIAFITVYCMVFGFLGF